MAMTRSVLFLQMEKKLCLLQTGTFTPPIQIQPTTKSMSILFPALMKFIPWIAMGKMLKDLLTMTVMMVDPFMIQLENTFVGEGFLQMDIRRKFTECPKMAATRNDLQTWAPCLGRLSSTHQTNI